LVKASFFHYSDSKTGKVIFTFLVHPGHLGGLTTYQSAASFQASLGNARDNRLAYCQLEFAGCEIVKKKQGFCALHEDIVDTHGHKIDANGVMAV